MGDILNRRDEVGADVQCRQFVLRMETLAPMTLAEQSDRNYADVMI